MKNAIIKKVFKFATTILLVKVLLICTNFDCVLMLKSLSAIFTYSCCCLIILIDLHVDLEPVIEASAFNFVNRVCIVSIEDNKSL